MLEFNKGPQTRSQKKKPKNANFLVSDSEKSHYTYEQPKKVNQAIKILTLFSLSLTHSSYPIARNQKEFIKSYEENNVMNESSQSILNFKLL